MLCMLVATLLSADIVFFVFVFANTFDSSQAVPHSYGIPRIIFQKKE